MESSTLNTHADINDNWIACPTCGAPMIVNPQTGDAEPCASHASKQVGAMGGVLLTAGRRLVDPIVECPKDVE